MNMYKIDEQFYWTGEVSEIDQSIGMPSGFVSDTPPELLPGEYARYAGGSWIVDTKGPKPPAVTTTQVDAERDSRIASGFMFNGKLIQSKMTDRENVSGAAQLAFMAIVGGALPGDLRWSDPDNDFAWIAADNTLFTLDAPGTVNMGKTAAAAKQNLIFKARELKNLNPIPIDYTDAKWW